MRPLTLTGVPAYPCTSFSSGEPSTHGWISDPCDCSHTATPKFTRGTEIRVQYRRSDPVSFTGAPNGHAGNRYCDTALVPLTVSPVWIVFSGVAVIVSSAGRVTSARYG